MATNETGGERRDSGGVLIVTGWVILAFDALVFFFFPSANRIGSRDLFLWIMAVLAFAGIAMIVAGHVVRNRARNL